MICLGINGGEFYGIETLLRSPHAYLFHKKYAILESEFIDSIICFRYITLRKYWKEYDDG